MREKHEEQPGPLEEDPKWRLQVLQRLLGNRKKTKFISRKWGTIEVKKSDKIMAFEIDICKSTELPNGLHLIVHNEGGFIGLAKANGSEKNYVTFPDFPIDELLKEISNKTTEKILDDLLDGKRETEITTKEYGRVKIEKRKKEYFILVNVSKKYPNGLVISISPEAKNTWAAESNAREFLKYIERFDFAEFVNNLKKTDDEDDQEIPGMAVSVRHQEIAESPPTESPLSVIRKGIQKIRKKVFPKERP